MIDACSGVHPASTIQERDAACWLSNTLIECDPPRPKAASSMASDVVELDSARRRAGHSFHHARPTGRGPTYVSTVSMACSVRTQLGSGAAPETTSAPPPPPAAPMSTWPVRPVRARTSRRSAGSEAHTAAAAIAYEEPRSVVHVRASALSSHAQRWPSTSGSTSHGIEISRLLRGLEASEHEEAAVEE